MLLAVLAAGAASCVDPAAYGAKPGDGISDAAAIQQAIDVAIQKGEDVCLGPGVFELERVSRKQIGSLMITSGPVTIRGVGPQTILRMQGDGIRGDWRAIEIRGGHDVVLHDFAIDGLAAYNTEEQTHLLEIGPDSKSVVVANMSFGPMRRPDQHTGQGIGGDCVRLLGNLGHEVEDVVVTRSTFKNCDRSGIAFNRALRRIAISDSYFEGTGDTPIDFEPTSRGAIDDVSMTDLDIHLPPDTQSAWGITIVGTQQLANRILLARTKIDGGGVMVLNASDVEIVDNEISHGWKSAPTVEVMRTATNVRIAHNKITRHAGTRAGMLIYATHNNKRAPHGVQIEDNVLRQETAGLVVSAQSVGGLSVKRNTIDYTGANASLPVVRVRPVINDVDDVQVEDNVVRGTTGGVFRADAAKFKVSAVQVRNNKVSNRP